MEQIKTQAQAAYREIKTITTNLPKDLKHLGLLYEQHLDELIREGGDVETFLALSDDVKYQEFTQSLLEIKALVDSEGIEGLTGNSTGSTREVPDLHGGTVLLEEASNDKRLQLIQHLTTASGYLEELPTEQAEVVMMSINMVTGCLLYTSPSPRDRG